MTIQQLIDQRGRVARVARGRVARTSAALLAVGFGVGVAGCSMSDDQDQARSGSAEMQPEVFTFAPPDGTKGVRTEHRRYEISLVGTPLRNLEETELRWNVESKRTGDSYEVSQELAHVTLKHDGATIVDQDVKPGAVSAELIIDRAGNLLDVRGLQGTSRTLQGFAVPNAGPAAQREFSTQSLKALVATRYEETLGDIIGRPTKLGTTWTTQGRPGGAVVSRTMTVEKTEPCGTALCTRLQGSYKLNPNTMVNLAQEVVRDYARWSGTAPSKLNVQAAMYSMDGSLLTEASTMINRQAELDETGKVLFAGTKRQMEIDLQGKTEISFEVTPPTASLPSPAATVAARP